jgi:hypothetical protein
MLYINRDLYFISKQYVEAHDAFETIDMCLLHRRPRCYNVQKGWNISTDLCGLKTKAVPLHAMKALWGRGGIAPTHSRPRNWNGGKWSASRPGRVLAPRKRPPSKQYFYILCNRLTGLLQVSFTHKITCCGNIRCSKLFSSVMHATVVPSTISLTHA